MAHPSGTAGKCNPCFSKARARLEGEECSTKRSQTLSGVSDPHYLLFLVFLWFLAGKGSGVFMRAFAEAAFHAGPQGDGGRTVLVAEAIGGSEGLLPTLV